MKLYHRKYFDSLPYNFFSIFFSKCFFFKCPKWTRSQLWDVSYILVFYKNFLSEFFFIRTILLDIFSTSCDKLTNQPTNQLTNGLKNIGRRFSIGRPKIRCSNHCLAIEKGRHHNITLLENCEYVLCAQIRS